MLRRGPGLIGTAARAGVAAGVAGRVHHRQQQRWAAEQQAGYEQQAAAAPPPQADDEYAELEKLAGLRDKGIITPEEFEAKKKELLGI